MDFVKFGIVGIGNIGTSHTNSISELSNAKLTAVCDINPKAFDRIKPAIRENIKCYTDAETFFKEADIDAVIIAVPHYSHPDLAIMAMQHGKHLIVEKPIAVHKKDAERMIAEAAKYPELKKSLMFCQRTLPAHKKIKQLIDQGELGKINRINWVITDWFRSQKYYDSGDWRASWRGEGGGVLLNQCPHQLDLWQWFFGLPKTVRGVVKFGKYHLGRNRRYDSCLTHRGSRERSACGKAACRTLCLARGRVRGASPRALPPDGVCAPH